MFYTSEVGPKKALSYLRSANLWNNEVEGLEGSTNTNFEYHAKTLPCALATRDLVIGEWCMYVYGVCFMQSIQSIFQYNIVDFICHLKILLYLLNKFNYWILNTVDSH